MNTAFPFSFLESVSNRLLPPAWMVEAGQQRLVLFLNHVLMQEKQAQERLERQKGRVVHLRWGPFSLNLQITPAGLVDRAATGAKPDLSLLIASESPFALIQTALAGERPPVVIEGDVQLAAEIAWLSENLRWDAEEDLSRLVGDAPAHAVATAGSRIADGLKQFVVRWQPARAADTPFRPAAAASANDLKKSDKQTASRATAVEPLPAQADTPTMLPKADA